MMDVSHYSSKKKHLLTDFDKTLRLVNDVFTRRFGQEQTIDLMDQARKEYEEIIPSIPYIGGKQPFTQFIISTAWSLSMYRVLKSIGTPVEEIGKLTFEASAKYVGESPEYIKRILGFLTFTSSFRRRLQRRAEESHRREYPGDYVFNYIEGDGIDFDYGVDYLECASCKFLESQDAIELAPYLCTADIPYSETLNWGLIRTKTLAEGYSHCDFRFKKGGETHVAVPKDIESFIERHRSR
ncbi:MAG: hypothetical protein GTO18_12405 [Anaerolineales bacterium]|nr:hypothetical protein [Anaerolineales bacterium]